MSVIYDKHVLLCHVTQVDKRVLPAEVALRSAVRDFEDVVLFDVDCTEALDFALHELQLVRLEMRGTSASRNVYQSQQPSHHQQHRTRHASSSSTSFTDDDSTLLFLGDVHTDRKQRQIYRPSGFQEPLAAIKVCKREVSVSVSVYSQGCMLIITSSPTRSVMLADRWVLSACICLSLCCLLLILV